MPEKATLLIIDDEEDMLETLSDILQEKGYWTETSKTGKEAITKAEERFFNVNLIDIKLPDMTGIEVLQTFRKKHPSRMNIIITAYATLQNVVEALNLGANAYIMKPIDPEKLDLMIKECLKKQQMFLMSRETPASLRNPEVNSILQAIKEGKITEFKPSFSYEKGIFYPEVEKIIPHSSINYDFLEDFEKCGIIRKDRFYDSILTCPSCGSHKVFIKLRCASCGSMDIDRGTAIEHLYCGYVDLGEKFVEGEKLICPKCGRELKAMGIDYRKPGIFFKCNTCDNIRSIPEHEYICGDCQESLSEEQISIKKVFTFKVEPESRWADHVYLIGIEDVIEATQ